MAQQTGSLDKPRKAGEETSKPSAHLDPSLQHFSDPSFDPVDFLNDTLPPLIRTSPQSRAIDDRRSTSIADLSTKTQSLLSQLSAQNARLSNTLNQLTDEILRSGGRLTYEVEVLRGETIGLSDTLTETLQDDIHKFLPNGLPAISQDTEEPTPSSEDKGDDPDVSSPNAETDPEYIHQLRTLIKVRGRLDEVIHVFGEAMEWPLPPSEVSMASSFISVSAPEPGSESHSLEEKGREVAKKLRTEITDLLDSDGGGEAGFEAATRRVEAIRLLATVWKGTAEEKARLKFVDGLAKIVEDRRKALDNQAREKEAREHRRGAGSPSKLSRTPTESPSREERASIGGGGGLFRNLQRLRDEIYLE